MSNLVGRVHFKAEIDGDKMPSDAQRVGMEAGRTGAKGFNDEWDKEFRKGLTAQGRRQLDHWKRRGSTDGLAYGRGLEVEVTKFADRLNRAFDNFQGIQIKEGFLDEAIGDTQNWEREVDKLRSQMELLNKQGSINETQFRKATSTIDDSSITSRSPSSGLPARRRNRPSWGLISRRR